MTMTNEDDRDGATSPAPGPHLELLWAQPCSILQGGTQVAMRIDAIEVYHVAMPLAVPWTTA